MLTAEETIQFHVILLAIDNNAVGLVMTKHQFTHIKTMSEAAVEHPRQHTALAAVVAIIFFHVLHVYLSIIFCFELFILLLIIYI